MAVGIDSLVFIEDAVGKHMSLPTHLQPAVWEVVQVDVLPAKLFADDAAFEDELPAIVGQRELLTDMALFDGGRARRQGAPA